MIDETTALAYRAIEADATLTLIPAVQGGSVAARPS